MTTLREFHQQVAHRFDMEELKGLVVDLGLDWDDLEGGTKSAKIYALITSLQRQRRLPELTEILPQLRPGFAWPAVHELTFAVTTAPANTPQQRNRQNILNNIHTTWIEGVLEPSLHNDVALSLGLSYQHDALNRPNRSLYPEEQPIPPETSLGEIFAARGRSLLILGEPASGKTIALLQLLQELLTAAQADPAEPIPIVLNLSSWARERTALTDWMEEELLLQYQAPRQLSRDWLAGSQLTLLLDGLDEVAAEQRDACVEAINSFKADHAADMVVCSRLADYQQLQARLNLSTAIRLQPLTPTQIDNYLASFGYPLAALRQAVANDENWRGLAQSPLMLNLMAFTYKEVPLPEGDGLGDRRSQLFTAYIQRNLHRRPLPAASLYNDQEALTWLHHIASQLQSHDQSLFQIERLQPSWLPATTPFRWLSGLIAGLLVGLLVGLLNGLVFRLIRGLLIGLLIGLSVGLSGIHDNEIELVEEVRWQRPFLPRLWAKAKEGLLVGLISGLVVGLIAGLSGGLIVGLIGGLICGLSGELILGLQAFIQTSETRQRTQPNQGIWASWRNARRTGLVYGLIFGLIFGLFARLIGGLIFGLIGGLISGLLVGLVQYGGEVVVQHYVLRWLLARQGVLPFPFQDRKLIAYLDEMAARLLLRRVGGGWMFIHRTLLEFFADEAEFQKLINDL
ncbi:MAG: hypothetical protein H6658_16490 [Ardenticatenaceae bacterium]|nr:hypothetical protein [Ardenticatenaceae bacterium]